MRWSPLSPHSMPKQCRYCDALSSLVNKEHVAEYRERVLYIGGSVPTDQQLEEMAREIQLLKKTTIWKVLTETVKAQAIDLGIKNAKDFDQLLFAKAMLHIVEVQNSAVNAILEENGLRKGKIGV